MDGDEINIVDRNGDGNFDGIDLSQDGIIDRDGGAIIAENLDGDDEVEIGVDIDEDGSIDYEIHAPDGTIVDLISPEDPDADGDNDVELITEEDADGNEVIVGIDTTPKDDDPEVGLIDVSGPIVGEDLDGDDNPDEIYIADPTPEEPNSGDETNLIDTDGDGDIDGIDTNGDKVIDEDGTIIEEDIDGDGDREVGLDNDPTDGNVDTEIDNPGDLVNPVSP